MAYNDKKIKVDSSQKKLNDKVINRIENTDEKVYWYVRFSQPLDETSVSEKTMIVTQTNGNIFKTNIIYNKNLELIVIEPLDIYLEDEYYILHIKKEVRSENLKNLKNDVHILFKIKGGQVCELSELGQNVVVPKPRKQKKDKRRPTKSKVYTFQRGDNSRNDTNQDILIYIKLNFNPFIGIGGILIFITGIFLKNFYVIGIGGIVAFLGIVHITMQIINKNFKSNLHYNIGVTYFNREKYEKAYRKFKKALSINIKNEYAEYALNKTYFYLN